MIHDALCTYKIVIRSQINSRKMIYTGVDHVNLQSV